MHRSGALTIFLLVFLDVGLRGVIRGVAANVSVLFLLEDTNIIDVEFSWPVLAVKCCGATVPRANSSVHDERHRLLRDHTWRRALALLAIVRLGAVLVLTKGVGIH